MVAGSLPVGDRGVAAALFAEPNPVVIKAVLHAEGMIPSPIVRLPLLEAGPDSVRAALEVLRCWRLPPEASVVQG